MTSRDAKRHPLFGWIPLVWLVAFLLLPLAFVLEISLTESAIAQPPHLPLFRRDADGELQILATLANYRLLVVDTLYASSYLSSLKTALLSTLCALVVGYPMAYAIARSAGTLRAVLLALAVLPFLTSLLIRIYAWKLLLQGGGLLNAALLGLGIVDVPVAVLYTDAAVYLGIVYAYLPLMVLPLYAVLSRLDPALLEAAADLGCRPWRAFLTVTLPLSLPGVLAGSMLVAIPAVGEFVIPEMLGGPGSRMIGRVLWTEFFANRDWPVACAVAVAMLALSLGPIALLQRHAWGDRA